MTCPCGEPVMLTRGGPYRFPQRPAPWNTIIHHALYFDDPFFGGDGTEFCSAKCSLEHTEKRRACASS
jgi:hypothetical protein